MKRRITDLIVRVLLFIAVLSGVVACTTARGSYCEIAKPTRLSPAAIAALSDTEVKKILADNRTGQKLCGWRP